MTIKELNNEELFSPLITLYENNGNSLIDGYLGEEISNIDIDENGYLIFSTFKKIDNDVIDTNGVILSDSVLLRQKIKSNNSNSYRLYSWDVDKNNYTLITFDKKFALDKYYESIKRFDVNLNSKDTSLLFREMGLSLLDVVEVIRIEEPIYNDNDNSFKK